MSFDHHDIPEPQSSPDQPDQPDEPVGPHVLPAFDKVKRVDLDLGTLPTPDPDRPGRRRWRRHEVSEIRSMANANLTREQQRLDAMMRSNGLEQEATQYGDPAVSHGRKAVAGESTRSALGAETMQKIDALAAGGFDIVTMADPAAHQAVSAVFLQLVVWELFGVRPSELRAIASRRGRPPQVDPDGDVLAVIVQALRWLGLRMNRVRGTEIEEAFGIRRQRVSDLERRDVRLEWLKGTPGWGVVGVEAPAEPTPRSDHEVTEVLAQIAALRADMQAVREDSAETKRVVLETAARIRDRFPTDGEVTAAVEALIDSVGGGGQ